MRPRLCSKLLDKSTLLPAPGSQVMMVLWQGSGWDQLVLSQLRSSRERLLPGTQAIPQVTIQCPMQILLLRALWLQ